MASLILETDNSKCHNSIRTDMRHIWCTIYPYISSEILGMRISFGTESSFHDIYLLPGQSGMLNTFCWSENMPRDVNLSEQKLHLLKWPPCTHPDQLLWMQVKMLNNQLRMPTCLTAKIPISVPISSIGWLGLLSLESELCKPVFVLNYW